MNAEHGVIFRYGGAVVAVLLAALATHAMQQWLGPANSLMFFPAVFVSAVYWGYGPALLATFLSTSALALFVPPENSFNIGIDDLIRLSVFVAVAAATASVSAARRRAEAALRSSLRDLQDVNTVLGKINEWPVLVGNDGAEATREMLEHAALIVGAAEALAVWEADQEPWLYLAMPSSVDVITKHRPADTSAVVSKALATCAPEYRDSAQGSRQKPALGLEFEGEDVASVPFKTEHLKGRVFFAGMGALAESVVPAVELVAREVGSSLDQLYLSDQMRVLAVNEERIRLARDLHDGVLQSLTGIRLQLQAMASDEQPAAAAKDRLLSIERAIASEQRELRLFIDDVRPERQVVAEAGDLAHALEEMRHRLGLEWKTPISVRVTPASTTLPQETSRTLRLMIHEAVVNALKHAQPSRVSVDVQAERDNSLRIIVANDGRGFPFKGRLDHDALLRSGEGPLSLRDRVVALGGKMAIESTAGGASVEITLALESLV
jgi:signal transduction histidine kinase